LGIFIPNGQEKMSKNFDFEQLNLFLPSQKWEQTGLKRLKSNEYERRNPSKEL